MRKIVNIIFYAKYQVYLYLWIIKIFWKHTKLQRYDVTYCLKIFHLHCRSLFIIQIAGTRPILAKNRKVYQKPFTRCSWIFLISAFYLAKPWKVVPTKNFQIWNFPATRYVDMPTKNFIKTSALLKRLRYWSARKLRLVIRKDLVLHANSGKLFCRK